MKFINYKIFASITFFLFVACSKSGHGGGNENPRTPLVGPDEDAEVPEDEDSEVAPTTSVKAVSMGMQSQIQSICPRQIVQNELFSHYLEVTVDESELEWSNVVSSWSSGGLYFDGVESFSFAHNSEMGMISGLVELQQSSFDSPIVLHWKGLSQESETGVWVEKNVQTMSIHDGKIFDGDIESTEAIGIASRFVNENDSHFLEWSLPSRFADLARSYPVWWLEIEVRNENHLKRETPIRIFSPSQNRFSADLFEWNSCLVFDSERSPKVHWISPRNGSPSQNDFSVAMAAFQSNSFRFSDFNFSGVTHTLLYLGSSPNFKWKNFKGLFPVRFGETDSNLKKWHELSEITTDSFSDQLLTINKNHPFDLKGIVTATLSFLSSKKSLSVYDDFVFTSTMFDRVKSKDPAHVVGRIFADKLEEARSSTEFVESIISDSGNVLESIAMLIGEPEVKRVLNGWFYDGDYDPEFHPSEFDDVDGDGILNYSERLIFLNPNDVDSDGDGFSDLSEISFRSDPALFSQYPEKIVIDGLFQDWISMIPQHLTLFEDEKGAEGQCPPSVLPTAIGALVEKNKLYFGAKFKELPKPLEKNHFTYWQLEVRHIDPALNKTYYISAGVKYIEVEESGRETLIRKQLPYRIREREFEVESTVIADKPSVPVFRINSFLTTPERSVLCHTTDWMHPTQVE